MALFTLLALSSMATALSTPFSCKTRDQDNPLAATHHAEITGVLNVTLAVVPIPLSVARGLIPEGVGILVEQYKDVFGEGEDMYPVIVQAGHDHDIRWYGLGMPDFSRAGFEFPFLDLLNDKLTPFRWASEQLISATNPIALAGSRTYGTTVHPSLFDPSCDAYSFGDSPNSTYFSAKSVLSQHFLSLNFSRTNIPRYPLSFLISAISQPIFASAKTCDDMERHFDTPLTTLSEFAPVAVEGTVRANLGPPLGEGEGEVFVFEKVHGFHVASAFIERSYVPCRELGGGEQERAFLQV